MKSQDIEHLKSVIQNANDIMDADRSKLLELLNTFSGYGLVWVDKQEENENKILNGQIPILKENLTRYIKANANTPSVPSKEEGQTTLAFETTQADSTTTPPPPAPHHLLIEGDNLPVLTALSYTHEGAIDVIYIDPPYNTGNQSWRYNNDFVEKDDPYKHSKFLSFLDKRLRLAKKLLKEEGILICAIDDYEQHNVRHLLDDIFGENNRLSSVVVMNKPSGRTTDKYFATAHEYCFFYANSQSSKIKIELLGLTPEQEKEYNLKDEVSHYKYRDFLRTGGFSTPEERPNSFYPIFYNPVTNEISLDEIDCCIKIEPIDTKGNPRVWRRTRPTFLNDLEKGDILIKKIKENYKVLIKDRIKAGMKPKTVWVDPSYDSSAHGTKLLEEILGTAKTFDFPKSLFAVKDSLFVTAKSKHNACILDFFAGSGTTLHAVMQLNAEDGGNRQCILVTNNENGIAEEVCYERNKRVITGYTKPNGTAVAGLRNNHLHYYKMEWFDELAAQAPLNLSKGETFQIEHSQIRLARLMRELLMIKENCFEDIEGEILRGYHPDLRYKDDNHPDLDVLESADKYLVIIYTDDAIADGVTIIEKLPNKEKPIIVYPFEYEGEPDNAPFEHIEHITVKALPNSYKATYDHILQDLRKRRRRFAISE